jgi:hypothetical protein
MGINNQYKSSVFSFLFSDPLVLRELYQALEGVSLPPDLAITINTLEGVLYKTLLNDLSFLVGERLVLLVEHQSTINPNMAVRLFIYLGRVYEKITAGANLYGRKKLIIPRPECIVLYNGVEPYPDEAVIPISEAFADIGALGLSERPPDLEFRVKVYNINKGHNPRIVERSETLWGYTTFIAKVREFEADAAGGRVPGRLSSDEKREAMKKAIRWCIGEGILKPFLETHGSEVVNMLMTEWNLEDALVVEREEGMEEGLAKGLAKGRKEGLAKGRKKGREEGRDIERQQVLELLDQGISLEELKRRLS